MKREFVILSEAWYGPACRTNRPDQPRDEICITTETDGGEVFLRWYDLELDVQTIRLEVHEDAWAAFADLADVLELLGRYNGRTPRPSAMAEALRQLGLTDATPRVNPRG